MDPEDLLRQIEEARARGRTDEEIARRLQQATDGEFVSIQQVERAAVQSRATARQDAARAPGAAPEPDQGVFAGIGRVGRLAGDVFTLGGLDEAAATLRGAVEGAGALVPGGRSPGEAFQQARDAELRASRQRLQQAREEAGPGTKAIGFGLGILGPALPVRAAAGTTRAARFGVPALTGAATGAAEGAAAGALSEDPDPELSLGESLRERAEAVPGPAAVGGAAGGILGPIVAGRAAAKAKPTAGERLGEAARRESGLSGRASKVTRDVAERKRTIRREQFKPLEELGELDDEALNRTLRSDDIRPALEEVAPEVAEGARSPTFLEAQSTLQRLRGLKDRAVRQGDSFEVAKFSKQSEEVADAIGEAVEGFPEAQRAWAVQQARIRALEEGRRLFKKTADDFEEGFRELSDDPGVREAFREGAAAEFVARLEKLSEPKAVLRQIQNSPQLRGKLETLFGDGEALERFTRETFAEQRIRDRGQLFERIKRFIGPVALGVEGFRRGTEAIGGILGGGSGGGGR